MNRQKALFFLIVGSAVVLAGVISIVRERLSPLNPVVLTRTALQGTETAIAATEVALRSTVTSTEAYAGPPKVGRTWNGLQIEVVGVETDGWPLVKAHNQFNEPPLPGKRMLLITVLVKKVEGKGEEPVTVSAADFKVVGERGAVYTTYGEETSCGVVPDELDGVVTGRHSISGAICVQVPEDEGGFVLIYEPFVGSEPAVYIPLP